VVEEGALRPPFETVAEQPPQEPSRNQWRGDVTVGVDAWTRRATPAEPAPPEDPQALGPDALRDGRSATSSGTTDAEEVARKILLDRLTGQARTRKELADRLAAKNVPADVATRLLDRFEDVGLVDDGAFARAWVGSRQPGKGLARRALAQELRRKGIDDETARAALDEIDPEDEREAARALVRKKLRSLRGVDQATATRRLVGMLARKGHSPGVAYAVIREELGAELEGLADD